MKDSLSYQVAKALAFDLQEFASICENALALAKREHLALASQANYQHFEFYKKRKSLLADIEEMLPKFRRHQTAWQQVSQPQRDLFTDLKRQFQNIQGLLMRVMLLDRENQQTMLKRGLVPAKHLPAAAAQRPHYVADLYRKNSQG
jgi:hypothetical protein